MNASEAVGLGFGIFAIICWVIFALIGLFLLTLSVKVQF
jgi:hypothetical protein